MTNAVAISVVIPTYQRRDLLSRAISAFQFQTMTPSAFEVVVAIDGSSDGTVEMIDQLQMPFQLRSCFQNNKGRAAACNMGITAAEGRTIVLLDDDMEPTPGFLVAHEQAQGLGDRMAVIGAAPISTTGALSVAERYSAEKFNRHVEYLSRVGGPMKLRDFYSGNFSVRRDALLQLGGFDESFAKYGNEDLDLCVRLRNAGFTLHFCPDARALQVNNKSFGQLATDSVAKGQTAVQLLRKYPAVARELKLGSYHQEAALRRIAVNLLLLMSRVVPSLNDRLAVNVERWGQRLPAIIRLYPMLLDFFYWWGAKNEIRGVRDA